MPQIRKPEQINFRITSNLRDRLNTVCKYTGYTISAVMTRALRKEVWALEKQMQREKEYATNKDQS